MEQGLLNMNEAFTAEAQRRRDKGSDQHEVFGGAPNTARDGACAPRKHAAKDRRFRRRDADGGDRDGRGPQDQDSRDDIAAAGELFKQPTITNRERHCL